MSNVNELNDSSKQKKEHSKQIRFKISVDRDLRKTSNEILDSELKRYTKIIEIAEYNKNILLEKIKQFDNTLLDEQHEQIREKFARINRDFVAAAVKEKEKNIVEINNQIKELQNKQNGLFSDNPLYNIIQARINRRKANLTQIKDKINSFGTDKKEAERKNTILKGEIIKILNEIIKQLEKEKELDIEIQHYEQNIIFYKKHMTNLKSNTLKEKENEEFNDLNNLLNYTEKVESTTLSPSEKHKLVDEFMKENSKGYVVGKPVKLKKVDSFRIYSDDPNITAKMIFYTNILDKLKSAPHIQPTTISMFNKGYSKSGGKSKRTYKRRKNSRIRLSKRFK